MRTVYCDLICFTTFVLVNQRMLSNAASYIWDLTTDVAGLRDHFMKEGHSVGCGRLFHDL